MGRSRLARPIGWLLTALSYVAAYLMVAFGDTEAWAFPGCAFAIIAFVVAIIVLAMMFKAPDLWAAAFISFIAPLMTFVWWIPYFVGA